MRRVSLSPSPESALCRRGDVIARRACEHAGAPIIAIDAAEIFAGVMLAARRALSW